MGIEIPEQQEPWRAAAGLHRPVLRHHLPSPHQQLCGRPLWAHQYFRSKHFRNIFQKTSFCYFRTCHHIWGFGDLHLHCLFIQQQCGVVFPDLPRPSRWPVTWRSMRRGRATTEQLKGLRPRSRIETKRKLKTDNVEESEAIVLDKLWIPSTFGSRLVVLSCGFLITSFH